MSSLSNTSEVLVVGAGPCGLLTALELARAGVEVEVIDHAQRSAAQSYACGLHPSTVALLSRYGLERSALDRGIRVESIGFYEGGERQAELRLNLLQSAFPYLLVLPQDHLEELLEQELRNRGVRIRWGHRLDRLRQDANSVTAIVEKLGITSVGYPYARSEQAVEKEIEVQARYLVGADGSRSHVRSTLGIETEQVRPAIAFEVYEFTPVAEPGREARVALSPGATDVFWPQPGSLCRWSLQVDAADMEHPPKERAAFVLFDEEKDLEIRQNVENRIRVRAPWFESGIKEIDWTTVVRFESMMCRTFGVGRCWLAGDAGHQTSPVGMQSMNVGLREAADLGGRLARILRQSSSPVLLADYDKERRAEWQDLLGVTGRLKAANGADPWVKLNQDRLLPLIPASGADLHELAGQLGLQGP